MAVEAARETMSADYVDALAQSFMDIPWETPEKHPDCSLLLPAPGHAGEP